jgi:hypothetical protein
MAVSGGGIMAWTPRRAALVHSSGISAERPEFVREASTADAKHQIAGALTEPPDGWMAPIYELFSDIQPLKRIKLTPPRRADIDLSVTRRILDIERVV